MDPKEARRKLIRKISSLIFVLLSRTLTYLHLTNIETKMKKNEALIQSKNVLNAY